MTLRPILASLIAGVGMPLPLVLAASWGQWSELTADSWRFGYLIFGPFTLAGAFAVAWPSNKLQRSDTPGLMRAAIALLICAVAGVAMLQPLSDRIAWEGAAFGAATFLVWLAVYWLVGFCQTNSKELRSEPSG